MFLSEDGHSLLSCILAAVPCYLQVCYAVSSHCSADLYLNVWCRTKHRGNGGARPLSCVMATFLLQTTLEGLGEKFSKAVAIMQWLAKCAKAVAAKERCVEWTTPLGLPVIQPYREKVCYSVK